MKSVTTQSTPQFIPLAPTPTLSIISYKFAAFKKNPCNTHNPLSLLNGGNSKNSGSLR